MQTRNGDKMNMKARLHTRNQIQDSTCVARVALASIYHAWLAAVGGSRFLANASDSVAFDVTVLLTLQLTELSPDAAASTLAWQIPPA